MSRQCVCGEAERARHLSRGREKDRETQREGGRETQREGDRKTQREGDRETQRERVSVANCSIVITRCAI